MSSIVFYGGRYVKIETISVDFFILGLGRKHILFLSNTSEMIKE